MNEDDRETTTPENAILQVAARILAEEGEEALTMDRLARESGSSRTTLYRSFGSRKELLARLASSQHIPVASLELNPDIRTRILDATQQVLSRTGSTQFTLEQVADEAGVGVATIYRHFGTKNDLLKQLSSRFYNPRLAAKELLMHSSGDVQHDLEDFVTHVVQFMQSMGEIPRMIFSGDARIRELFHFNHTEQERTLTNLTRYLDDQIKAGRIKSIDPFDLAAAFMGMIIGFVFIKPSYTKAQESPQQIAQTVVKIFLTGVLKGQS